MTLLVRKVTPAKWRGEEWASAEKIPADALTLCMRTSRNTLSFWRVGNGENSEEEAILALLGTQDRIEKIDLVFVEDESIANVAFESTPGKTIFTELADLHMDAVSLDHDAMLSAARALASHVYGETTRSISRKDFQSRLQAALDNGRIAWELIPEKMQRDLKRPEV